MKRYVKFLLFTVFIVIPTLIVSEFFGFSIISSLLISQSSSHKQIEVNPVYSNNIDVNLYLKGLSYPTSMVFVDNHTLLVLEKNHGNIRLIYDGILHSEPLFKVQNLSSNEERGLLGIAVLNKNDTRNISYLKDDLTKNPLSMNNISTSFINNNNNTSNNYIDDKHDFESSYYLVYLYFTEKIYNTNSNDSKDNTLEFTVRNRIYEYTWDGKSSLSNPRLIMDLPAEPGPYHNGGKMKIDKDGRLYAVIGDLTNVSNALQNYPNGSESSNFIPNNSSVIVRIDPSIHSNILKDNPFFEYYYNNNSGLHHLIFYYAYGIRNSFGIDIDPVTGNLWDTENGEDTYDEINLVEPGFNSGWYKVMGPMQRNNYSTTSDLVMFNGSHYSDPEFSWKTPIGVTDIEFLKSPNLGKDLLDGIFVGDINNGNLYFFALNSSRSGIDFNNTVKEESNRKGLDDMVADDQIESQSTIFAKGFDGRITDIETGPDGNLYILTYFDGSIYKISNTG